MREKKKVSRGRVFERSDSFFSNTIILGSQVLLRFIGFLKNNTHTSQKVREKQGFER